MQKHYHVGIYARISSKRKVIKNSVWVQIDLIKDYIKRRKLEGEKFEIVDCYIDEGVSGSHFQRPEWMRLFRDLNIGKIDCIIVKDFSRLGRNYLEVGEYIESIFPMMKVRFISVLDQFDTEDQMYSFKKFDFDLKNLINDFYVKEFSAKALKQYEMRRIQGNYLGSFAPYGYDIAVVDDIRSLIVDLKRKNIVMEIYENYFVNHSIKKIINDLYHRKINPPMEYRKTKEVYGGEKLQFWNAYTVKKILTNVVYVGAIYYPKTNKTIWNCHEAIISQERFREVQRLISLPEH